MKAISMAQTAAVLRRSVRSPLGKPARRARLGLLLVSVFSLIATQTGLIPTDLLTPHLRQQLDNYMTLLKFSLFFNILFLITFTTCALLDCLNWRRYGEPAAPRQASTAPGRADLGKSSTEQQRASRIPATIRLRLLVDLALPCLLALYAIAASIRIMYLHYITFSLHP